MELTKELIDGLRGIANQGTVRINGEDYLVLENEVLPDAEFDPRKEVERYEEGFELFLIRKGERPPETDFMDADFRLRCIDHDVEYRLVETIEGTEDVSGKYDNSHTINYVYDDGKTLVYKSDYKPKSVGDVRVSFVTIEEDEIPLESLEIPKAGK